MQPRCRQVDPGDTKNFWMTGDNLVGITSSGQSLNWLIRHEWMICQRIMTFRTSILALILDINDLSGWLISLAFHLPQRKKISKWIDFWMKVKSCPWKRKQNDSCWRRTNVDLKYALNRQNSLIASKFNLMAVCMYVCLCIMYVCMHACMCVYVCVHVCVYVCVCIYFDDFPGDNNVQVA